MVGGFHRGLAWAACVAGLASGALLTWGATLAEAQEAPETEAAAPVLVPPGLAQFVEATYPSAAEAEGLEATVELEITIGADGLVTEARVVTEAGHGFDEAALAAVERFVFTPASRDGEPIPARIRYRYVFELTAPPPAPEEPLEPLPGRLEGRLLGQEDADPIVGAEVVLTSPDASVARRALTGADGRFRFDELPAGAYELRITTDEYGALEQAEEVAEGEATEVLYRMRITSGEEEITFGATAVIDPPPREVTRRTIRREELTRIPGTRGDALRAIELLPGIARPAFGSGDLIVRGSAPQDSEVFLDGIPVPLLYHFGGLTSFMNSRLIERIDFFPGNFSSRYGRKMGGIVEVGARDPAQDRFHGVAELSVIDVSVLAEGPIGEDFAIAVAARRSMIDLVFEYIVPEDTIDVVAAPVYWDYQVFGTWQVTDRDRLRLMFYGSNDSFKLFFDEPLGDDPAVRGGASLSARFFYNQIGWDHSYDNVEQDIDIMVGPVDLDFSLGQDIEFHGRFNQVYVRSEWRAALSPRVRVIAGMDLFIVPFRLTYEGPAPRQTEGNPDRSPLAGQDTVFVDVDDVVWRPGFYTESDIRPWDPLQLVLGLRLDYYSAIEDWTFDPRLTAIYSLSDSWRIKGGIGLHSQPPEFQESNADLGNPELEPIRSAHYGFGTDVDVADGITVGLEGFYKRLWNRVVGTDGGELPRFTNEGIGRIYGMELSGRVQPAGRRWFGFLSYTLSRSERRDRPGADWRLFDFDQTHIFTISGVYKLPRNWELGATLRLVSGNPRTPIDGSVRLENFDVWIPVNGATNSERNPLFNRLDIRVEKQWTFASWKLAAFLDIQNVYNQQNQESLIFNYDFAESTPISGLPIIPAIGIRGEI